MYFRHYAERLIKSLLFKYAEILHCEDKTVSLKRSRGEIVVDYGCNSCKKIKSSNKFFTVII